MKTISKPKPTERRVGSRPRLDLDEAAAACPAEKEATAGERTQIRGGGNESTTTTTRGGLKRLGSIFDELGLFEPVPTTKRPKRTSELSPHSAAHAHSSTHRKPFEALQEMVVEETMCAFPAASEGECRPPGAQKVSLPLRNQPVNPATGSTQKANAATVHTIENGAEEESSCEACFNSTPGDSEHAYISSQGSGCSAKLQRQSSRELGFEAMEWMRGADDGDDSDDSDGGITFC